MCKKYVPWQSIPKHFEHELRQRLRIASECYGKFKNGLGRYPCNPKHNSKTGNMFLGIAQPKKVPLELEFDPETSC